MFAVSYLSTGLQLFLPLPTRLQIIAALCLQISDDSNLLFLKISYCPQNPAIAYANLTSIHRLLHITLLPLGATAARCCFILLDPFFPVGGQPPRVPKPLPLDQLQSDRW